MSGDCGSGHGNRTVADMGLGHGCCMLRIRQIRVQRVSGIPEQSASAFHLQRHGRQLVLERLELADGVTELFAFLGIAHRHFQTALRASECVGGKQHQGSIEQPVYRRATGIKGMDNRCIGKGDCGHLAAAVGRGLRGDLHPLSRGHQSHAAADSAHQEQFCCMGGLHKANGAGNGDTIGSHFPTTGFGCIVPGQGGH